MPNLKFFINKDIDGLKVFNMLKIDDPAGLESRARSMGIELNVAEQVKNFNLEQAGEILEPIMNQRYAEIGDKLETIRQWYQQSWDEINDKFFDIVAKRTEHNWQYPEYKCLVSVIHPGLSDWRGNTIVRIWSENPFTMRRITAHELIVAHIFSIFHNDPKYQGTLEDNQIWKIAEISGWCLTGLEPDLINFWPWVPKHRLFYYDHNYPMLVELQKMLVEIYKKTRNFDDFLDKAINEVTMG